MNVIREHQQEKENGATSLGKDKKTIKTWAFCKDPSVPSSMSNTESTFDSTTTESYNNTSVNLIHV